MAPKFELSVVNAQAIVANLYSGDRIIKREAKRIVNDLADFVYDETRRTCAYDTGFMHDHLRKIITRAGLTFEVGWDATDFISQGKAFYPFFVEYGTVNMAAQPALEPAYKKGAVKFRADLTRGLREAINRIDNRGGTSFTATSRGLR